MERRFQTKDELEHFDFEDAVLERLSVRAAVSR